MIIGISGKIGSGKDTVGSIIQWLQLCKDYPAIWGPDYNKEACAGLGTFENFMGTGHTWRSDWEIKKFAAKMKQCVSIITGVTVADLERMDVKNGFVGPDWGSLTYRNILQLLGTEVGRSIHENFWVNALFADYESIASAWDCDGITTVERYPNWIITDMRFPNELAAVKQRGGITIRLTREVECADPAIALHPSETALDKARFDYVICNNGSIEDLISLVNHIIKPLI
jgi:hypothetical protein